MYNYPAPGTYGYQPPRKRHRGRNAVIWIVVVLALLVGLDFGAKAFAENEAAIQIQKHGFPAKPHVSIAGFPFLVQVITRHFQPVTITSSDIPAGPVAITSLRVVARNVRLNADFKSGTAGPVNGSILISLGAIGDALAAAGPLATFIGGGSKSLTITSVGGDEVKGSLTLLGGAVSWSAVWRVTAAGPSEIDLRLVSSSGLPAGLLGPAQDIRLPLSSLPAGLRLTGGLTASSRGISANVFARSISFGS